MAQDGYAVARNVGQGLGWFSLALGAAEILAPDRIREALGARRGTGLIRAFGGREVMAGVGLLQAPAHAARAWNRVAGDAMDLAALLPLLRRDNPRRGAAIAAIAFVGAVTLVDVLTARALGRSPDPALGRIGG